MMRNVTKWRIEVIDINNKVLNEFHIDDDFLSNVMDVVRKINFGINVNKIIVSKVNLQSSISGLGSAKL